MRRVRRPRTSRRRATATRRVDADNRSARSQAPRPLPGRPKPTDLQHESPIDPLPASARQRATDARRYRRLSPSVRSRRPGCPAPLYHHRRDASAPGDEGGIVGSRQGVRKEFRPPLCPPSFPQALQAAFPRNWDAPGARSGGVGRVRRCARRAGATARALRSLATVIANSERSLWDRARRLCG
jgi:hypothetical protein